MNAMILAAGRGERLRPYTDSCPKPLLEINGKPMIQYHLDALRAAGITDIVINTSWLAPMLESKLGDGKDLGINITYSREDEALETAGGIIQALPKLHDRFMVINGDVFTDYPIKPLINVESTAHLVLVENPEHNTKGDFTLNDGVLGNQLEHRYTFSGIAVYQKSFFVDRPSGKQALAPWLRQAVDAGVVTGELYNGQWTDVGTLKRWQSITDD